MEIKKYICQKKELYDILLEYIDCNDQLSIYFQNLIDIFENQEIKESQAEFRLFLHTLSKISKNHYRDQFFSHKIEKILIYMKEDIKQTFSNSQIMNIFKNNKLILLFLLTNQIIDNDEFFEFVIIKNDIDYFSFFYVEMKGILDEKVRLQIEEELSRAGNDNFEENRLKGENEKCICEIIRKDMIDEFVIYVNRTNLPLSKWTIQHSIFETNSFLLKNKKGTTLIEYAFFFGAIQIVKYLLLSQVKLTSSLWLFAIHSNSADMIHLLEENHVIPEDESYEEVLKEAIKCHHNEIAEYIQDNLLDQDVEQDNIEINFDENVLSYSFHYCNFRFFPNNFSNKFVFYYACLYDYYEIVEFLLKNKRIKINEKLDEIHFKFYSKNS